MANLGSSSVLGNLSVTKKIKTGILEIRDDVIYLKDNMILAPDCNGCVRKAQTMATITDSGMQVVSGIPDTSTISFSKIGTGHYRISNINSFGNDDWGISVPRSNYDVPLLVVETTAGGGDLNIYTYSPELKIGNPYATKGASSNIPSGVSLTVNINI